MIKQLRLQAVRSAWTSYIRKMKLEEFGEMVFIEGFVAGEKCAKRLMVGNESRQGISLLVRVAS